MYYTVWAKTQRRKIGELKAGPLKSLAHENHAISGETLCFA